MGIHKSSLLECLCIGMCIQLNIHIIAIAYWCIFIAQTTLAYLKCKVTYLNMLSKFLLQNFCLLFCCCCCWHPGWELQFPAFVILISKIIEREKKPGFTVGGKTMVCGMRCDYRYTVPYNIAFCKALVTKMSSVFQDPPVDSKCLPMF